MTNILIAGVGGQGTVLASKLIAEAAIRKGLHVRTTETIGMAQRGGSVVSHVRIGVLVHSPLVSPGSADLLVAFEPAEGARLLPFLRESGAVVVCDRAVQPVSASLAGKGYPADKLLKYIQTHAANRTVIRASEIFEICSPKMLNTALLGAAHHTGFMPCTLTEFEQVLREKLPERFINPNLQALHAGYRLGRKGG